MKEFGPGKLLVLVIGEWRVSVCPHLPAGIESAEVQKGECLVGLTPGRGDVDPEGST
jgi:hypothetical protein